MPSSRDVKTTKAAPGSLRRALWILAVATLVPIIPFAVIGELPGERWLTGAGSGSLRFGATGSALLALDVFLPIPSSIVGTLLGARLGVTSGFLWAWAGLCAGNLFGYALGRLVPSRFQSELPRAPTLAVVFLSRPVPVLAEAVAIASGTMRLSPSRFTLVAAAGNAVYAAAMAANGAELLPAGWLGPGLVLPMGLPVLSYAAWRLAARRARTTRV